MEINKHRLDSTILQLVDESLVQSKFNSTNPGFRWCGSTATQCTPASDEAFLVGCDLCLWEASSCHAVTLRMDQHVEPLERNLHIGQLESIGIMPLGIILFPMQK